MATRFVVDTSDVKCCVQIKEFKANGQEVIRNHIIPVGSHGNIFTLHVGMTLHGVELVDDKSPQGTEMVVYETIVDAPK